VKALVIGSGAVGLGVGSCLLEAGKDVVFVTRSGRSDDLRTRGLLRTGIFGEARLPPARFGVVDALDALRGEAFDFVLVCTKTFASAEVARALAGAGLRGNPAIVLMHNGWGSAEVFADILSRDRRERIFNARVITGFRRSAPNAVEITVHAEPIRLGSLFGVDQSPLEALASAIAQGGVPCEVSASIERDLWAKLLYNCALNPLGALRRLPYGELAASPLNQAIMANVVREIFEVARGRFELQWTSAGEYLRFLYEVLLPPTATHESSMLQDLRAGQRTEIDALCGAVAALGEQHEVATPVNAALRDLVHAAEHS
jgi:2-dehydropantoate 2-reductase